MLIGINAVAAVRQPRTGVEEYVYQLIKHLTMLPEAREHRFLLYASEPKKNLNQNFTNNYFGFPLPDNFEIKILRWPLPFLWTQIRLAWEMLVRPPEALLIPVHILPFFRPKNSVVSIHGLEYEYFPEYYPVPQRFYLRWSTKYALKRARKIIAISENTKNDLIKLYGGDKRKIEVVYHGTEPEIFNFSFRPAGRQFSVFSQTQNYKIRALKPYLLYLGRIEKKKNIEGILEAYRILKEKYRVPHELILAGAAGYGYGALKLKIEDYLKFENLKLQIKELGYISEDTKRQLLKNAEIFLFPSFYEGFGLPVLESQASGTPVVTSYNSCLPEIAGEGALFVNPKNPQQIAEAAKSLIDDKNLRDKLIESGFKNSRKFSWEKCARETLNILRFDR